MAADIQPADFTFFSTLVACGSLSAAARELGVTTPAVSKRLALMESRLGLVLLGRTTRRMGLTPEGELYLEHARRVLAEIDELAQQLGSAKATPQGLLRVNATLGFGRRNIAPLVARFVRKYPHVDVQLQLSVNPPLIADDAFDVCIRFGEPPDSRVVARCIARNRRLLCAAPTYLAQRGEPKTPRELATHNCISIRQGDEPQGVWRLSGGRGIHRRTEAVRVHGNLVTNDGEVGVSWALDGHGILMRAEWDITDHLRSGRLVTVLTQFDTPDANVFAVYPQRHQHSARVRAFVDFVGEALKSGGVSV